MTYYFLISPDSLPQATAMGDAQAEPNKLSFTTEDLKKFTFYTSDEDAFKSDPQGQFMVCSLDVTLPRDGYRTTRELFMKKPGWNRPVSFEFVGTLPAEGVTFGIIERKAAAVGNPSLAALGRGPGMGDVEPPAAGGDLVETPTGPARQRKQSVAMEPLAEDVVVEHGVTPQQ